MSSTAPTRSRGVLGRATPTFALASNRIADLIARIPFPVALAVLAAAAFVFNVVPRPAPFWSDEAYTVLHVKAHDFHDMLLVNLRNEETPPLYFVLLRLWAAAWGSTSETTLRAFSALCLAATAPLIGLLGSMLLSRKVGLVAATLFAVNPFAHYYGQEARAYALALLLAAAVLLTARLYRRQPRPLTFLLYVLFGSMLLYTSYFGAFTLAGSGTLIGWWLLDHWWWDRRRATLNPLLGWIAAQCCILLLFVPWVPAVVYQVAVSTAARAPAHHDLATQLLLTLLVLGTNYPDGSVIAALLMVLVGMAFVFATVQVMRFASAYQRLWLLATLFVQTFAGLVLLAGDGQYAPRYVLLALPAYVLLIATGLLYQGRLARVFIPILVVCSAWYSFTVQPTPQRRIGWDRIARVVEQRATGDQALFFAPPWSEPAFDIQYHGPDLARHGAASFAEYYFRDQHPYLEALDQRDLEQVLKRGQTVWIAWDLNYAQRPQLPPNVTVEEQRFGTTALLHIIPQ